PLGSASPQAVAPSSRPPRAARSHSASVGSRQRPPHSAASQSANATASCQLTPTTGWSAPSKPRLPHHGGGGASVAHKNAENSAFVTGVRPIANADTETRRDGPSSGRPKSEPMRKSPPGTES